MRTNTRAAIFAVSRSMAQAFLLVLVIAAAVVASEAAPVDEKNKSVLLLFSEEPTLPAQAILEQSIRSTLKNGSPVPVEIYTEYLDALRTPVEVYEKELLNLLRRKYEGRKFDLIVAVSSTSFRVLLKNQPQLFPDTPVVFFVLDQRHVAGHNLGPNWTGVWGELNYKPNLDLALALHPDTKKVVVLAGVGNFDKFWTDRLREDFLAYKGKVEITYLIGLSISEQRQALAGLPPQTIVLLVASSRDNAGNNFSTHEVLRQISPASSAPIYGVADPQLGLGIVGGSLLSYEALGEETGKVGLRILAGEKPQAIAPHGVPNVVMFDWRELRRWGIDESSLPPGSIVRYKESSVWELNKWRIIGAVALIILQALLIIWLLVNRSRRRQTENDNERLARLAEDERRRLDEVVSNVPGIVWEARSEPGTNKRKAVFVSEYVEKMLGYSVEEWKSTPGFAQTIIPEEDREQSAREAQALIEKGRDGVLQFRWITKDGRILWVQSQVAPIFDQTGKAVGLRGVTMDITDRRLAEEALRASEERLKQAISVARFGVFEHDHLTESLNTSPMTREIHGWGEDDRSNLKGLVAQVHPEDREAFLSAVERAHDPAGDGSFTREYRIVDKGGEIRWISARARTFFEEENGVRRPVRTIGAELDITERKEAEEALRAAAEEVSRLKNQLQEENLYLQEEIKSTLNVDEIVGRSNAIKYVLFKIEQVCQTDSTVMILGETGTGKELVARAIHSQSLRKDRPLVKVNCAAFSAGLIESELFGHEKGSFTGASARKIGRFELADGATLFLDEIGELPLDLQSKLLRVIQEGEFERLGSSKTMKVDVRIIAATNRNMKAEVEKGAFREDLWYRLNVFPITVPPLRQRKEDIPPMVEHFVSSFSRKVGKNITADSSATLKRLQDYSWPGNVRELANVIERGVINAQGPVLHITDQFEQTTSPQPTGTSHTLDEIEKEYITRILGDTAWKIEGPNGAAKILGLNPSTLRTRMVKLGIQKGAHNSAKG